MPRYIRYFTRTKEQPKKKKKNNARRKLPTQGLYLVKPNEILSS